MGVRNSGGSLREGTTHHVAGSDVGSDILDDIDRGSGSQGFVPPLGPGDYTFWAQDVGFQASYTMRFVLPEPSRATMLAAGAAALAALVAHRSRRRRA
jgi:hypothetical protein